MVQSERVETDNHKTANLLLAVLIDVILLMAYVSLALSAHSGGVEIVVYVRFALIWLVISLISLVAFQIPRIFVQYGQIFFKLAPGETLKLVQRLVLGPSQYPPLEPVLHIQDGKVLSEIPGVIEKVGGPGFLAVEHNNAVVTQKLGVLWRILGPGFHTLEAFEKVWDVVDLRPQRRTINVRFMTRDGIPACADAEVVFRIPFIDEYMRMKNYWRSPADITNSVADAIPVQPSSFSAEAVLAVTTGKIVNGPQAYVQISDWITCLSDDILDEIVRDILEQYTLDAFLYPQYWLSLKETVNLDGQTEYKLVRPQPMMNHKSEIEAKVKARAEEHGIFVEYVELGPVLPVEDAISRAWLEFWQAKLQSVVYQHSLKVNVDPVDNGERARVAILVDLLTNTVQRIQRLPENELKVPPALPVLSFLDVLQSMSDHDPDMQKLVNRNIEKLTHIVDAIQRPDPPAEDMQTAPLH
jgi:hypothetical protein